MGDISVVRAPAWRQRELVLAGQLSVLELTRLTLAAIESADTELHAFRHVAHEAATRRAAELDAALRCGATPGPLFGVPLSIKDLYWTADMPTTAGSLLFENWQPTEDAVHVARARAAGGVVVGKTNVPEFGLFPRTRNRLGPETVNPWDPTRTCGGSSGGAAASVGAGVTPLAIASDGGGSTRIPAALCGVMGLLPTRGLLPRHGGVGGTLLFSQAGPIARDARDMAVLLQVLAGPDPRDPLGRGEQPLDYLATLEHGVAGLRLCWVSDSGVAEVDPKVVETAKLAAQRFTEAGATVNIAERGFDAGDWVEPFYAMMGADRYASIGIELFEDPDKRRMLSEYGESHFSRAREVTGVTYSRALETRYRARRSLHQLFGDADLLLSPTVGIVAPRLDEPIERLPLVAFTFFCNYTGFPAATVPCGFVDGIPVGLHVIGRPGSEPMILRACRAFEQLHPPTWPFASGKAMPMA